MCSSLSAIVWSGVTPLVENTGRKSNKISIFWEITQCSSLTVNRPFGGTCRLDRRITKQETRVKQVASRFSCCFLLSLFFDPENRGDISPKRLLTFNGLQGVAFQNIELKTAAVRTPDTREIINFALKKCYSLSSIVGLWHCDNYRHGKCSF
jgi:hypothetical protein